MCSPPTKIVIGFSSSGCHHPMMQFHTQKQQVTAGTNTEKGNYSLQSKRRFLLLKQVNARLPGHVSSTHTATRTSAAAFWGHLTSAILFADVSLKANKYCHHQSNSPKLTLLEENSISLATSSSYLDLLDPTDSLLY